MQSTNPVLLLVGLIACSTALSLLRRFFIRDEHSSLLKLFFQLSITCTIALVSFMPELARAATRLLGFGDNLNTLIFVAFIILFFLIYKLTLTIDALEMRLTKMAQKVALRE
jgi:hypothetical protein